MMAHSPITLPSNSPNCNKHWPGIDIGLLAFDFDGTCTVHDTTSLFYKASDKYRHSLDEKAKQIIDQEWETIGLQYTTGYQKTIEKLLENLPCQENSGLNKTRLRQFLMEVHDFDSQSTKKVEESKLLAGITNEGIADIAKEVDLKPGCLDVLEQFNLTLHVISFNWSKDLIKNVLGKLKNLSITGNTFPQINNKSTGIIDKKVSSSLDKEKAFQHLLKAINPQSGLSVFIGDSIGDLLALLQADIGIVVGASSTMKRVCKAFGVRLTPLNELYNHCESVSNLETSNTKHVLYTTNSWQEIGELLLGKMTYDS